MIKNLYRVINEAESYEPNWVPNSAISLRNKFLLKKWRAQLRKIKVAKTCAEVELLDKKLLKQALIFYSTVTDYLHHLLTGAFPSTATTSTIPVQVPNIFAALPEWFVEDCVELLLILLQ